MPLQSGGKLIPETIGQTRMVVARFAGGGSAANCTKVGYSAGLSNVITNGATGAYQLQFSSSFQRLDGLYLQIGDGGNTTAQHVVTYQPSSVNVTAGTVNVFVTDVATPTARDLTAVEELSIIAMIHVEGVYAT